MLRAVNDMVFKFIFGTEERKELLRGLVNLVLARVDLPLASTITLRNPFNLRQFEHDKESILDIGAADENGRMFDVEMQISRQKAYGSRALYYWSRMYGAQLPEAGDFDSLHPVVGIHLVDFILHPEKRHFIKLYRPLDVLDPVRDEASVLSMDEIAVILELPLMDRGGDCGRLEKLLFLLESEGGNQAMTDSLAEEDRFFAEVDEAYRMFTANPELMYLYEARRKGQMDKATSIAEARRDGLAEGKAEGLAEGKAEGEAEGEAKGIAEGKLEGKTETARRFKELGVDVDIITRATGLSKDVIAAL